MKINEAHFTVDTRKIRDEIRKAAAELRAKGARDVDDGVWHVGSPDGKLHIDIQLALLKDCYEKLGNIFPI